MLDTLTTHTLACAYAVAVADTKRRREALDDAYTAWRYANEEHDFIERRSPEWDAMMLATAEEYRQLRNAKSREYRAKEKLLRFVKG